MGFDFTPRNKKAGGYHLGAFSWPSMLEEGLGLVLGVGKGFGPGSFIWITRPDNLCVEYNDGARVTATEAKELAKVARWIARIQEARLKEWQKVSPEKQNEIIDDKTGYYRSAWSAEAIHKFSAFADWAEKSGGFRIY